MSIEIYTKIERTDILIQTSTFSAQILASYLNVFVGLNINSNIMIIRTKGLTYAGMLS